MNFCLFIYFFFVFLCRAPHFKNRNGGYGGNDKKDFRGPRNGTNFKPSRPQKFGEKQMKAIDWDSMKLKELKKDLYVESPITKNRSSSEIRMFFDKFDIKVVTNDGQKAPNPTLTFDEIHFPDYITKEIRREGFEKPTPIQATSFPVAMSGRNLVSIAQTGSGKTLGYMLPAIVQINNQNQQNFSQSNAPRALILAPTRELAQQIQQVASQFGQSSYIRNTCLFGGTGKYQQEREVRRGVDVVIATPGRLIDFLEMGTLSLQQVTYVVLDEADRMLDMGFEPQIRKILSQIRPDRQMLMWSATWPREVQQIAHEFIANYVQINVGSVNLSANHNIQQNIEIVDDYDKNDKLMHLLSKPELQDNKTKIIIFSTTKKRCEKVNQYLNRNGFRSVVMHGDKSQQEREYALKQFRNDRANILVATDVAARGLDVDGIGIVINYDYPQMTEDYVHRIGRTGRKDSKGVSYTFFTENDSKQARQLVDILEEANQEIDPQLKKWASRGFGGGNNGYRRYGSGGGGGGGYNRSQGSFKRNTVNFDNNRKFGNDFGGKRNFDSQNKEASTGQRKNHMRFD